MNPKAETPKRLTLSEIVDRLLTRPAGGSHVSVSRNAKGDVQIDVSVRVLDEGEVTTLEAAKARAVELYDELAALYPLAATGDNAEVSLTRNAKGETQVAVEVKSVGERGGETLEDAGERAATLYESLRARFPTLTGAVGS